MARIRMDRSGEMEVFVKVVQEGGFSAAARAIGLTPSAVSKLIVRLEERLGVRLLQRTTRALTLTQEGDVYHRSAQRILQQLDEADQSVATGTLRGRLAINASIPFGNLFVAPIIPAFLAQHPELTIDLTFTDDVVDLLAKRADVAIRMGTLPDSGLIARKLGESRRVVCAAPGYLDRRGIPETPADLENHECLTFNFRRSRRGWPFKERGRGLEQPVFGSLQVNNGETMRRLAVAGAGVARLGLFHVAGDIDCGDLVPLLEEYNPGDLEMVNAVYLGGGRVPPQVRAFIDYMKETLKTQPWNH